MTGYKVAKRRTILLSAILILSMLTTLSGCQKEKKAEREAQASSEIQSTEAVTEGTPETENTEPEEETENPEDAEKAPEEVSEEISSDETLTETEAPATEETVTVNDLSTKFIVTGAESLNVRADHSLDAEIIDGLLKNASGTVTGVTSDGAWYRIDLNGQSGYIAASFVTVGEEAEALIASAEAEAEANRASHTGLTVCIDAGHQQHGISETEPNGPGSSVMKAKLTTGTAGCVTGRAEYEVNLEVSLKLQEELTNRGYNVVMIRTTNDCPMSNAERAVYANNSGADIFVRIHCNSLTNSEVTGVINYAPSAANPYLSAEVISKSNTLAALLADSMCAATGATNRGVLQDDTMTGINWCQIPVSIVEMGFMSNPTEDQLLSDPDYQWKLARGMADGIDRYFGK